MIQTRTTRNKILVEAHRRHDLHNLVWVVIQSIPGEGDYGVGAAGSLVTLPATPMPEESGHYAHLMMEVLRLRLPPSSALRLEIWGVPELLHDFGESDFACPGCTNAPDDCTCQPVVKHSLSADNCNTQYFLTCVNVLQWLSNIKIL